MKIEKTKVRHTDVYRVYNDKGFIVGYVHDLTEYKKGWYCEVSSQKSPSTNESVGWRKETKEEAAQSLIDSREKFLKRVIIL